MKKLIIACVAAPLFIEQSAFALERSGSNDLDFNGRKIHSSFSMNYDPASRTFTRKGNVTLMNGMSFTYQVDGKCTAPPTSCDLTGTGTGPTGRKWTGEGKVSSVDGKTMLNATLLGPAERRIVVNRQVEGDLIPELGLE